MEEQKVTRHQKCHECRKVLALKDDPNMSYVILNSDQMNINESTLNPDLPIGELRRGKNKQQLLFHAVQTGELLAKNVCFECYEKLVGDLNTSIDATEQVRQDYADNLRSMEEEKRSRSFGPTLRIHQRDQGRRFEERGRRAEKTKRNATKAKCRLRRRA